ncbi:DUF3267 domain-containing protein [Salimicrobium halophilum]|uniref:Putative zincin peptidase n=1 Tax=Salimicrobium halophilum TaxID=86666 RepID=A0A1G8TNT7_9BACI|nr:DUF3267 domain-containing protein [Salimicrobium halophilum]SDJ43097.1 Putative zincin peptidase [Salimicrobium halophilum]
MMNCWKSVNINKEFGLNRIYLFSVLIGLLSFLFLFIPLSMYHGTNDVKDYGLLPVVVVLFLLPLLHRLMHMLPLMLTYKRMKVFFKFRRRFFPTFFYQCKSKLSKRTSILMALGPTLFITIPSYMMAFMFPDYFVYFMIITSVNVAMSFTDFLYLYHFMKAPRRCIIENAKDGYDILIHRKEA